MFTQYRFRNRLKAVALSVILMALALTALFGVGYVSSEANAAVPQQAMTSGSRTVTHLSATEIVTGTATTTGRFLAGADVWMLGSGRYKTATLFLTGSDIGASETLTIKPQFSHNGIDWYDALHIIPNWSNGTLGRAAVTHTLTADGNTYVRFELHAPFVRYHLISAVGPTTADLTVVYER